jgi:serine/threonine protein kinase
MSVQSPEEFCEVLERSRLLDQPALDTVRALLRRPTQPKALHLAQWCVKHGHVTVWQAEQLLAGRSQFFLVGTYKIIDQISEGAMGEVFRAEHHIMRRTVAVKVLSKARLTHPNAVARFYREVEAMGALEHPNIALAYDAGEINKTYYLVMEFIDGSDLNAWLEKYQRLPIAWACEFIRQAALGLDHAHQRGMVHRDIKPANIMVTWNQDERRPVVKVLDLGLARAVGDVREELRDVSENSALGSLLSGLPAGGSGPSLLGDSLTEVGAAEFVLGNQSHLTQAGTIVGTPDYLAPEQVTGGEVDARTDVFGLGCTLFKLLTGELPYDGRNLYWKLQARLSPDMPPAAPLRGLVPEASGELEAIVARMLERDPEKRYKTAAEVALALAPYAEAPRERWTELCPSKAPPRDSSEVGSSQMLADIRLRDFFGGLVGEEKPGATAEDLPTIRSGSTATRRDGKSGPRAAVGDSQSVLDDEPDPKGSSVILERQRQRLRQRLLAVSILILSLAMMAVAFWRIVLGPPGGAHADVPDWPGDQPELVFAWQSGGFGQKQFLAATPELAARLAWERKEPVHIDEAGRLNLAGGAFHLPGAESALVEACRRSQEFSLELMFTPTELLQYRSGRIATFSRGDRLRNFTLAQEGRFLHFQLHTSETSGDDRQLRLGQIPDARPLHVIVSFRPGRLASYFNGKLSGERTDQPGDLTAWREEGSKLLFGNEADGSRPWKGRVHRVAIYSRFIDASEAALRYAMVTK